LKTQDSKAPDFWQKHDIHYRLFSQFCDLDDWYNILLTIASHFTWKGPRVSRALLDVGAGTGINTNALLEMLYAKHQVRHVVSVVEPSSIARKRIATNVVPELEGGFLRHVFAHFSELGNRRFDGVLFLHSTYYIPDFELVLRRTVREHTEKGGVVVCAALAGNSPFFLGQTPAQPNLSEDIERIAKANRWRYDVQLLPSHYRVPDTIQLAERTLKHLHSFVCDGTAMTFQDFVSAFRTHLVTASGAGVDLKDRLITIRR
jgi:SAM-dependent methyltransferase